MSVTPLTGSDCAYRFRHWAIAPAPAPSDVEDLCAGIRHYQPEDLPELIEILHEAEQVCAAELADAKTRLQNDRRQEGGGNTVQRLSAIVRAESCGRWGRRMQFLQELRHFLEQEQQTHTTNCAAD